jgi:hypothetical protein
MYDGMQIIHLFGYNEELSKVRCTLSSYLLLGKNCNQHIGLLQVRTMIY